MDNGGILHLAGLFPQELEEICKYHGFPAFRGKQIFHWIQSKAVTTFEQMINLPKALRDILERDYTTPLPLFLVTTRVSKDGTEKYLFELGDGSTIETVLLPEDERQTICISTQVGCAMNCSFCATGQGGFVRNLNAGEIVAQVLWVQNRLIEQDLAITNVVYMGMGEPLANYDAVLKSAKLLNHAEGLNLGARRLTLSTCGLVPQILALAEEELQLNLAISLHASTDGRRSEIMPVNRRFPLKELLAACDYYTEKTGRRISYEYALIRGFNDTIEEAQALSNLLKHRLCHVNLIPVNPVGGTFDRPSMQRILNFAEVLGKAHIPVSIRKERGTDIEAACGQLRQSQGRSRE